MKEMWEGVERDKKAKRQQAGGQAALKHKGTTRLVHRPDAEKTEHLQLLLTFSFLLLQLFTLHASPFWFCFIFHIDKPQSGSYLHISKRLYYHIMGTHSYTHRSRHLLCCFVYVMIVQLLRSPGQQSQPVKLIRSWLSGFTLWKKALRK